MAASLIAAISMPSARTLCQRPRVVLGFSQADPQRHAGKLVSVRRSQHLQQFFADYRVRLPALTGGNIISIDQRYKSDFQRAILSSSPFAALFRVTLFRLPYVCAERM